MLQKVNNNYYQKCYEKYNNIIPLEKLIEYHYILNNNDIINSPKSLTKATFEYLLKELNKNEQLSNWEFRPLTNKQIIYASLDSHSMLGIIGAIIFDIKLKTQKEIELIKNNETINKQTEIETQIQMNVLTDTPTALEIEVEDSQIIETIENEMNKQNIIVRNESIQITKKQKRELNIKKQYNGMDCILNSIMNNELLSNQLCEVYQTYLNK